MAKLTFNQGYSWNGEYSDTIFTPSGYKSDIRQGYDQKLFDHYVNNFDYGNARKYLSMFSFDNDPERENKKRALLVDLEREEKRRQAFTKAAGSNDNIDAVNFSSSVFNKQALAEVDPRNPYKQRFNEKKDFIFEREQGGEKIQLNFGREDDELLWGLIKSHNSNCFKDFMKASGYNETYLKNNGVVIGKDQYNNDIVTIDYNNPIANEILYNIGKHSTASNPYDLGKLIGTRVSYKVLDKNDKELKKSGEPTYNPFNFNKVRGADDYYLRQLSDLIEEPKSIEKVVEDRAEKRTYSSLLYGYLDDRAAQAMQRLEYETDSGTRQALKSIVDNQNTLMMNQLIGAGLHNYQIYTDRYNDEDGDQTMVEIDSGRISEVSNVLSEAIAKNKLYVQLAEVNGMFGAYLTVPGTTKDGDVKTKSFSVFVNGFLADEVKSRMQGDNTYLAVHEMDDITAFDYEKDLNDGRSIGKEMTELGEQWYIKDRDGNKENVTSNQILSTLKVEYGLEKGYESLYNKYTNLKGEVTNIKELNQILRRYTIGIINNAYSDAEDITEEEAFDGKEGAAVRDDYTVGWMKNNKLNEARQFYAKLLNRFNLTSTK